MKYIIKDISFSRREEMSNPSEDLSSEVKCYIVAHASYCYNSFSGSVSSDIYLAATKKYSSEGSLQVITGSGEFPSQDSILESLKSEIEVDISKKIASETYESYIQESLAKLMTLAGLSHNSFVVNSEN